MPCQSYDYEETARDQRRELDEVTRLLCSLCNNSTPAKIALVRGLPEWWERHQRLDRDRQAAEKANRARELEQDLAEYERLRKKLGRRG